MAGGANPPNSSLYSHSSLPSLLSNARIVRLEAWLLRDRLHGLWLGRACRPPLDDDGLRRAARDHHGPGEQERGAASRDVKGELVLFHRPMTAFGGTSRGDRASRSHDLSSHDLINWGPPYAMIEPRAGAFRDSLRIGIGPPQLKTDEAGSRSTTA